MADNENHVEKILEEINPTDETQLLQLITRRFIEADLYRQKQVDKWDKFYKYYRQYREPKSFPWFSNLFVPSAFTVIETLLPRVILPILGDRIFFRILPRESKDAEYAKLTEELLAYQFEQINVYDKFYQWIKNFLLYGIGIIKIFWRIDVKETIITIPEIVDGVKIGRKRVQQPITLFDGPDFEVIDPYDFYIDPRATSIENARWCLHRFWRDYDYLVEKQQQGIYKNVELVKPGVEIKDITKSVREQVSGAPTAFLESDRFKIELWEYWENDRVVVIANRKVILRDEKNPFWHKQKPFIAIRNLQMPHEFYGISEIEPIESLIHERNEIRNQRLDNMKTIVNKVLIVDRNADIDLDRLEENNRPGGVILTNNVNAIRPLIEGDILPSAYQEDLMILRDIQDATALSEYAIGTMPRRSETATAVMQLQQAAMSRISLKIQNVLQNGILPLVKMFIQLNQQFMDKPQVVRIVGEKDYEFKEIAPEDIPLNYDVIPVVTLSETNKEIKRQQLLLLAGLPLYNLPNVNVEEFQKEILRQFDIKDVDKYIKPMPQVPPELAEQLQRAAPRRGGAGRRRTRRAPGVPSISGVQVSPLPTT
jgi:hypothetical protein